MLLLSDPHALSDDVAGPDAEVAATGMGAPLALPIPRPSRTPPSRPRKGRTAERDDVQGSDHASETRPDLSDERR